MSENGTQFNPRDYGSDLIIEKRPVDTQEIGSTTIIGIDLPSESKEEIVTAIKNGEEVLWAYNPNEKKLKIWVNTRNPDAPHSKFPSQVEPAGFKIGAYGFLTKKGIEWDEVHQTLTYASLAEGTEADRDEHKDTQIVRDIENSLANFTATL